MRNHFGHAFVALIVTAVAGLIAAAVGASVVGAFVIALIVGVLGLGALEITAPGRRKRRAKKRASETAPAPGSLEAVIRVEVVDPPLVQPYTFPGRWEIFLRVTNLTAQAHSFQAKVVNMAGVAQPAPLCPWPIPWRSRITTDCDIAGADTELLRLATVDPVNLESAKPRAGSPPPNWSPMKVTFHELHVGIATPIDRDAYLGDVRDWDDLYTRDMFVDITIWEVGVPSPQPALTRTLFIGLAQDGPALGLRLGFVH